jgi:hypothetical protein
LLLQPVSNEACLVGGQLPTPYFLPQNIPTLWPEQVWREQVIVIGLQTAAIGMKTSADALPNAGS